MENCKEISKCVCCESENLRSILDLGNQSPANNYNVKEKFPLRLNVCLDCSHAQLSHSVNPDILFKDYPYMSGVSKTMRDYYGTFAKAFNGEYPQAKSVFEIACNDCSQLDEFKKMGFQTSGIDPAENISKRLDHGNIYRQLANLNHNVICGYFPDVLPKGAFDIVLAQNVFAHVDNPFEFLQGCKKIMHENSILVIQTSQGKMLENHQSDTIYHEHISFFNKRSISKLFSRADFEIVDYSFIPEIHGGSDLYVLKKLPEISILDYSDFSNRCYKFADEFRERVAEIQKDHKIICYGAAAKMVNLIRFAGIKPDVIIDDTPTKIDKKIEGVLVNPGSHLKLVSLSGSVIIPVWNFFDEIKTKVERDHPGKFKFLRYTPEIELI